MERKLKDAVEGAALRGLRGLGTLNPKPSTPNPRGLESRGIQALETLNPQKIGEVEQTAGSSDQKIEKSEYTLFFWGGGGGGALGFGA